MKPRRKSARNRVDRLRGHEQVLDVMNANGIPRLFTTAEVAGVLKVHPRTLARLSGDVRSKFPRPFRVGHSLRWRADQLTAWLEAQS